MFVYKIETDLPTMQDMRAALDLASNMLRTAAMQTELISPSNDRAAYVLLIEKANTIRKLERIVDNAIADELGLPRRGDGHPLDNIVSRYTNFGKPEEQRNA